MYRTSTGEEIFIIDGHVHNWNASKDNIKNVHGQQFIDCFYAYHKGLSPADQVWPKDKFDQYGVGADVSRFVRGRPGRHGDPSMHLSDGFLQNGFNTIEQNAEMKDRAPDRIILNGAFDPRDGEKGLDALSAMAEKYKIKGVKLYTAEWKGDSRGYSLTDKMSYKYLEHCEKLGIKNIHVHKGPTIIPLDRDAFDVADIDHVATDFQGLNFIVEHCGLPRLDDFCWIAMQETNVYGGLAVALPFIHPRQDYFANVISELLFWLGEDKLLFGSDYGIWTPRWLVDAFHGLRTARRGKTGEGRRSDIAGEEEDSWAECGAALWHRYRCAEKEDRGFAREGSGLTMAEGGAAGRASEREADVRRALARVDDPELDEPVTDLRFIERVEIDAAGAVSIGFRLPTYWCAANFAFLMADDMRREVGCAALGHACAGCTWASICMPRRSIMAWRRGFRSGRASVRRHPGSCTICGAIFW